MRSSWERKSCRVIVGFFLYMTCFNVFISCQRAPVPGFSFGQLFKIVSPNEKAFYNRLV